MSKEEKGEISIKSALSRDETIVYDRQNLLGLTKVPLTNTNKVSLVRPEFSTLCFNFKIHIVQTPNGHGKKVAFALHYCLGTHVKFSLHMFLLYSIVYISTRVIDKLILKAY